MELDTRSGKSNQVEFDVPGIGHFVALKQPTAPTIYFSSRNEIATLVGGQVQLAEIEATIETYKDTSDEVKKAIVLKCMTILSDAQTYIDLKTLIVESPREFDIQNAEHFRKVGGAFNEARDFFRLRDQPKTGKDVPASESPK